MAMQLDVQDLSAPMTAALEKVRCGEEVTISDQGRPVARIVRVEASGHPIFGSLKGIIQMSEDFDAPLPEDELREWEK